MAFIITIIVLLWFFLIVFLPANYQKTKTRDIVRVASTVANNLVNETDSTQFYQELKKIAYDNNMSIEISNAAGISLYSVDMMAGGGELNGKGELSELKMMQYRQMILNSENGIIYYTVMNERYNTKTLLFGMLIGSRDNPLFLFINTSVEPLDSTISILAEQMVYITVALLILGLLISFFMARSIARPIVKITKSAEVLAQGNYNITFDGKGYDEVEKLAATLNYASTEISKVDNLRRDLIANISHDLRTPLTMVKAYAEMIRDLSGDNPKKRSEHLNVIIEESDRLAGLVNDILDLSKIESGNNELNLSEFGISQKLEEILDRYKLLSEQKGYKFIFERDEEVIVKADVIKIEQVIYNLINNAVNYTGEDKTVTVRQINKPASVRIEISDTGVGIPKDQLPLIFDRYYRTEKSKREVIGSGLGLSIVKAILKQHSFPFGVHSEIGKGSTFWFEIILK